MKKLFRYLASIEVGLVMIMFLLGYIAYVAGFFLMEYKKAFPLGLNVNLTIFGG